MSDTLDRLYQARSMAWAKLRPAFDWAIHEAIEAEYRAKRTADEAMCGVDPKYPPIVALLAESVEVPF